MEMKLTEPNESSVLSRILDTYRVRQAVLLALDVCIILIGFLLSSNLTGIEGTLGISNVMIPVSLYIICTVTMFGVFKCYSSLWRYAGTEELLSICMHKQQYYLCYQ